MIGLHRCEWIEVMKGLRHNWIDVGRIGIIHRAATVGDCDAELTVEL